MQNALHIRTQVLPGRKVEVTAAELQEGETVEVFVIRPTSVHASRPSALQLIESLNGHRHFPNAADVDRHLRQERDSWDH
ncbi:MAG TPA: hypothetical protein VLI90_02265 [Tepidisphaeraceae bacterium]|nr:hypothetical protein [Tepidisphaeraceae bacterium]